MLSKSEVKYIQSLSQKKFRDKENLFIIEGPKIVEEALKAAPKNVKKLFALPDWIENNKKILSEVEVAPIDTIDLDRISQLKTPNKVIALMEAPWSEGFVLRTNELALVLDGIQDPGNMGTLIRIADWFGVQQVICSPDCADIYNPKVVQASMGSTFRVEVFYTPLPDWLATVKAVPVLGAALQGKPLSSFEKTGRGLLVIGNESKGIRKEVMEFVEQKITIERLGHAESLNAAVAAGIILAYLK